MKITKIEVKNFRILENVSINLDNDATLIVGRNNSGKTSLTEAFYKFLGGENTHFKFEDFTMSSGDRIKKAYLLYEEYLKAIRSKKDDDDTLLEKEKNYKESIPQIEVNIFIEYLDTDNLASLSKFIMDLDTKRNDVLLSCQYQLANSAKFFEEFKANSSEYKKDILEFFRKTFKTYYTTKFYAIDERDRSNRIEIVNKVDIENVFITKFIYAQRNLDDQAIDNKKKLSKGFEEFYKLNKNLNKKDVADIEKALETVSENIDGKYRTLFKTIFDDLKQFGLEEGINLQQLTIKSLFEAEKILKGNTQLFYRYDDTSLLPESYNGLGYSNLIFITLQFISFFETYDKRKPRPNFQLLFVEEPEVHLHPQMQYVFIKNIEDFIRSKEGWNVQVLITTHSSHIIADSRFENIRYFDNSVKPLVCRDLSDFIKTQTPSNHQFLKQYMSLNNCDMFFADKIIMVEGTVERLLLPLIIRRDHKKMVSKYVSVIEVGGAYAHIFEEFLSFINVTTLVITDIDSINSYDHNKSCKVGDADKTCNEVLKTWIPKKDTIKALLACTEVDKIKGKFRVAFQIPDNGSNTCGRSFEEAFILSNADVLSNITSGSIMKELFQNESKADILNKSYDLSGKLKKRKTDFAFDIMLLGKWKTPQYITEGLTWLEKN